MSRRSLSLWLLALASFGLASCATEPTPEARQQVFGQPDSTIPWNSPQRWEGQAGGFNAMRGGEGY